MKIFVTLSDIGGFTVIWNVPAYTEKTFRQCGWAPDFVFEEEKLLEGNENHPLLPILRYALFAQKVCRNTDLQ